MDLLTELIRNKKISLLGKTYEVGKDTKYLLNLRDPQGDHGRGTSFVAMGDGSANGFLLSSGPNVRRFCVVAGQAIESPIAEPQGFDRMNRRSYASVMY
jgi:hypothetical protein